MWAAGRLARGRGGRPVAFTLAAAALLAAGGCGRTGAAAAPAAPVPTRPRDAGPPSPDAEGPAGPRRLVGEHEPVAQVALAWGAGGFDGFHLALVRALYGRVPISLVVAPADWVHAAAALTEAGLDDRRRVEVVVWPIDTPWIRDFGPLAVRTAHGGLEVMDTPYAADRPHDDAVPGALAARLGLPRARLPYLLEGGHVQGDGQGRCLLADDAVARNAEEGVPPAELLAALEARLGCAELAVVPTLVGEPTGHLDLFVYVSAPGAALVGAYHRRDDPENARRLDLVAQQLADAGFRVVRVPMPSNDGRRRFRSYVNALAVNERVLVPVYAADRRFERPALRAFAAAFPGREIVPVASDAPAEWGGAVHCAALSLPGR